MIPPFHKTIKVLASLPAATPQQLRAVKNKFPDIPDEYIRLMSQATEIELGLPNDRYLRIWEPGGCIDMDEGYSISRSMPDAIPIGDDGGGRVIFYAVGSNGFGLYRVGFGVLDLEGATWIAPNLEALLYRGVGIDRI